MKMNHTIHKFSINNKNDMPLEITIQLATEEEKSIIQNMGRFYAYDLSRSCGRFENRYDWSFPEDGLYEAMDYSNFWGEANHFPFIVHINGELGGFALINKKGYLKNSEWYMSEFFIVGKFQGLGVGNEVSKWLFNHFKGRWEVAQMLSNKPAILFWRKTIDEATQGKYIESEHDVLLPEPHKMNIFQFTS